MKRGKRIGIKIKKGKIDSFLTTALIALLLPLFITIFYQKIRIGQLVGVLGQTESEAETEDIDGLVGIVAKEIGADAPSECKKAQAVIARTNLLAARAADADEPDAMTVSEMKNLWGENFSEVYGRFQSAVAETAGETLQYHGDYIYAAYHAVSAGNTRNIGELYAGVEMPYLTSVECRTDCEADGYLKVLYWSKEDFLKICQNAFSDAEIADISEAAVTARDGAGYVLFVQVGDKTYGGEEFRQAFSLSSSNFSLSYDGTNARIVTKGIGHGFGLSQYAAEKMAEDGSTYEEILNYFFPGAEIADR